MKKTIVIAALACTAIASTAAAQSLTTLFAGNNLGNAGGGVYFDITTVGGAIQVLGFDVNTGALVGTAIAFEVWTHPVTWDGFHNSSAGWTRVGVGTGTAAGMDIPSAITLNAPFTLPGGTTLGMAITLGTVAHAYTNGAGGLAQTFSNAELSMTLGGATNVFFGAGRFFPRVWNGTIYYIPAPSSLALLGLGGLVAFRRRR